MKETTKSRIAGAKSWFLLFAFLIIVVFVIKVAVPWTIDRKNDIVYGKLRTTHLAVDMNPTDSNTELSYFTALNIEGHIFVYSPSLSEPSQSIELKGLTLHGKYADREPILLSTMLFNDDPYLDLVVTVNGDPMVYQAMNGSLILVENPPENALISP